jgi:hypothetical protein
LSSNGERDNGGTAITTSQFNESLFLPLKEVLQKVVANCHQKTHQCGRLRIDVAG